MLLILANVVVIFNLKIAEAEEKIQKQVGGNAEGDISKRAEVHGFHPASYWDEFYGMMQDNFFKNRNWLGLEFPELFQVSSDMDTVPMIMELGCGVGNAVLPILEECVKISKPVHLVACDYSKVAIGMYYLL